GTGLGCYRTVAGDAARRHARAVAAAGPGHLLQRHPQHELRLCVEKPAAPGDGADLAAHPGLRRAVCLALSRLASAAVHTPPQSWAADRRGAGALRQQGRRDQGHYFNKRRRVRPRATQKAPAATPASTRTCVKACAGTSPLSKGRTSATACESGSTQAAQRAASGNWSSGKNTPERKIMGVITSVK